MLTNITGSLSDSEYMELRKFNFCFASNRCQHCHREANYAGEIKIHPASGLELCDDCTREFNESSKEYAVLVSFGYPRWYGEYEFSSTLDAESFRKLWNV